jgi:hypothetical protein
MTSTSIYSDQKYVVYHTTYAGDKFPQNYIGSSTIDNIKRGYKGSVCSKQFKALWELELKTNPHLFSIEIISYHDTRPSATYKELQIQKLFNVVKNPLFINKSYAQPNGFYGMNMSRENHPRYNKTNSKEHRDKISTSNKGKSPTKEHRIKLSNANKGKPCLEETKIKLSIIMKSKPSSLKGIPQLKITCPYCYKTGGATNMQRYHFDKCKKKVLTK